VTSNLH